MLANAARVDALAVGDFDTEATCVRATPHPLTSEVVFMDRKLAETPGSDEWWIKRLFESWRGAGRPLSCSWYEGDLPRPDNQKPNLIGSSGSRAPTWPP